MKSLIYSLALVTVCSGIFSSVVNADKPTATPMPGAYEIQVKQSGQFVRINGAPGSDQLAMTKNLPTAYFRTFRLRPNADGSYTFICTGNNRPLHVDGLGDQFASTRAVIEDDYTKFFLEPQDDGSYRLILKGTGRYLSIDPNSQMLMTADQTDNGFSHFYLLSSVTL